MCIWHFGVVDVCASCCQWDITEAMVISRERYGTVKNKNKMLFCLLTLLFLYIACAYNGMLEFL